MDDLNTTVENMSKDELHNEFIKIKTQNQVFTKKIEDCEQQFYETKRQLATSKLMEQELMSEIESLQSGDKSEVNNLKKKIASLEEDVIHLKQGNYDLVQQYEQDLKNKDTELEVLKEKMENDLKDVEEKNNNEIMNKLNDEIYEHKSKIESLLEHIEEYRLKNDELTRQNLSLENRLTEISNNLEEMREFFAIKKKELEASNERFNNLQDELMVTQMELDKYKNIPEDKAKKGNSLFAEVEDNRQKLKKYIREMNKKFADLKINYNKKNLELQELQSAYAILKSARDENLEDEQTRMIDSYENSMEKMKENIEALQKELALRKETTQKILSGKQLCTEALIEITRKEVMDLRTQLTNQQFSRISGEKTLYDTRRELQKWKLEALSLQSEALILKQTMEDLKIKNSSVIESPRELDSPTEAKVECSTLTENMIKKGKDTYSKILKEEKSSKSTVGEPILKENKVNKVKEIESKKPKEESIRTRIFGPETQRVLNDIAFDEEKMFEQVRSSKYKGTKFWKERTLTVIESDLDKSESDYDKINSELDINVESLEKDLMKLYIENKSSSGTVTEENKENVGVLNFESEVENNLSENDKLKSKKVSFTENTVEPKNSAPRRGRILVPKNVLHISSNK